MSNVVRSAHYFANKEEFIAAGGAPSYGIGPVFIGGEQRWCNGKGLSPSVSKSIKPVLVCIGDSINAGQNAIDTSFVASGSGNVGVISSFDLGVVPKSTIYLSGFAQNEWNGMKTVETWDGAQTITFKNEKTLSASPSSASGMSPNALADDLPNLRGFLHNFNNSIGKPFKIYNRAVSGTTSDFTLAKFVIDVLSLNPSVIYDNVGMNDVNSGTVTEAGTIANITAMATLANSLGIQYWRAEITPINETGSAYTLAKKQQILRINQKLKLLAAQLPNFILIPANAALTDKTTGNAVAAYFDDPTGIHPNSGGMNQIYKLLLATFSNIYPAINRLVTDGLSVYNYDNTSRQAVRNPLCNGSASAVGTGTTGTMPTNFGVFWLNRAGTGVAAVSTVARSDGYGFDVQAVLSGASNDNDMLAIRPTVDLSAFSNGDIVQMSFSLSRSGVSLLRAVGISLFHSSTWMTVMNTNGDPGTNFFGLNDDVTNLPIISEPFVWGAWSSVINCLQILAITRANAVGAIKVGRISLEKIG